MNEIISYRLAKSYHTLITYNEIFGNNDRGRECIDNFIITILIVVSLLFIRHIVYGDEILRTECIEYNVLHHINGFISEINENLSIREFYPHKDVSRYSRTTFIIIKKL